MLVSAGCMGQSLLLHPQAVRSCSKQDPHWSCHTGGKNFWLSRGLPMLLVKVMKGKSSVTCIKISNGTMQLEVCHSAFAFHSFCHRGPELETINQRITSPKGLLAVLFSFPLLFFQSTLLCWSPPTLSESAVLFTFEMCVEAKPYIYVSDNFI